ncbi:hypothetical protein [Streptomyces sp. NPDC005385]|uniref:hypothetical protein n=1 Tax=Streptomyces sp. NPDC005385 TaxID=3157039 RepID=UPI0033AB2418
MEVQKYIPGYNEKLDALLDGETVWRINGPNGLRPIVADSEEEAIAKYNELPKRGI